MAGNAATQPGDRVKQRWVAVNEDGQRVGETHPRARLTDVEIDEMFALHKRGMSAREIARWFGRSKSHVADILRHRKRNQLAVTWRRPLAAGSKR